MEPRGIDTVVSRQISTDFARYGCLLSPGDGIVESRTALSDAAVYDAVRRLILQQVRILHRRQFISYAVTGGKSVLKFRRFAYGMHRDVPADAFEHIAPPLAPVLSGDLVEGETYVVRGSAGDRIQYAGRTITPGTTFVAIRRQRKYKTTGNAEVRIHNGIRTVARPRGWTNRWVMSLQTQPYALGAANIYKADAYADHFQWHNPCLWQLLYGGNDAFEAHVNYGETVNIDEVPTGSGRYTKSINAARVSISYINPEAPDAYNYAEGANFGTPSADFYRACQIYRPPVEVESVTSEAGVDGQEVVTITFTRRLDYDPVAPAAVDEDPLAWPPADLSNIAFGQTYRTPDNALCEYARHTVDPTYQVQRKLGDIAWAPSASNWPAGVFGSGYPRFIFTALIPEPYADANNVLDGYDTRAVFETLFQVETALRAGCEGFLDPVSTAALNNCRAGETGCVADSKGLYDYLWENLIYQAAGNRYVTPFPAAIRPDNPAGYGPLPNTRLFADVFNALAAATDLLTACRVTLPCKLVQKQTTHTGTLYLTEDDIDDCGYASGASYSYGSWYGTPPAATVPGSPTDAGFEEVSFVTALCGAGLSHTYPIWAITSAITTAEWRFSLVDPNAAYAIPTAWRADVIGGQLGTLFCRQVAVYDATNGNYWRPEACGERFPFDTACGLEQIVRETSDCYWGVAGTLDPGKPAAGWMYWGYDGSFPPLNCTGGPGQSIFLTPLFAEPPVFIQSQLLPPGSSAAPS